MDLINIILSNPLYKLLIGGGGILVIVVTFVAAITSKKRKIHKYNAINVKNSKKTVISDNTLDNQSIRIKDSKDTTIKNNKG